MKYLNYLSQQINSIGKIYNKSSTWGKIFILFLLLVLIVVIFKGTKSTRKREGFQQNDQFLIKRDGEVYDHFYADIYDYLVFNEIKNEFEIGEIVNKTSPSSKSVILDIGCGTGHHVSRLAQQDLNVIGIDISPDMIAKAKENYPDYDFRVADAMINGTFQPSTFTHILCLYFTIYYFKDKLMFFNNCYDWLMPGGYLIVHLVNRDHFDPILPPGNPLMIVHSLQVEVSKCFPVTQSR